ncbi:hypothetical protein EOA88_24400 [Mesorhizobium sp. M5C.F.Ca.IN.020.14.1.1]|nr:hypothetical protein EOA88_24400 [Mesorhizobium sp. M5C.F.Ca.IN.020.14.1.1]
MTRMTAQMRARAHKRMIQRDFPHQVALPFYMCCEENYTQLAEFCSREGLDHQTTSVIAKWPNCKELEYRLYCFRTRQAAETFAIHFEGIHFDPVKDRDGGRINGAWVRRDKWKPIERCGPLSVPRFFRENP